MRRPVGRAARLGYTRSMATPRRAGARERLPLPTPALVGRAFERLARARALQTLVRGALPLGLLRRMLRDAMPRRAAAEMPAEVWSSLAAAIALENAGFREALARALHDRLAWEQEPADLDGWWGPVVDRPLEALWMAALSGSKVVRKEFAHLAGHCVENHRARADPPSWEFVEGLTDVQATTARRLREAEHAADEAARRIESERRRASDLRDALAAARRELGDAQADRARAERRAAAVDAAAREPAASDADPDAELRRRLRRSEQEVEHLRRALARAREPAASRAPRPAPRDDDDPIDAADPEEGRSPDPNPRRRLVRQMLRKLLAKGKVGAAHTHEDNVYRGVPDHEKGLAKEAIDLLYREGFLLPKPTAADRHVSLHPERVAEVRAIVAGRLTNPRLLRFLDE